jgi:hypothetical protein
MAKVSMPKLESKIFSGWAFVLVAGLLLALYAIVDGGGLAEQGSSDPAGTGTTVTTDGATGCRLEVTTDELNVRAAPAQDAELLRTLPRGELVDGTRIEANFYRRLADGGWGATEFLTPVPGTNCS